MENTLDKKPHLPYNCESKVDFYPLAETESRLLTASKKSI